MTTRLDALGSYALNIVYKKFFALYQQYKKTYLKKLLPKRATDSCTI